MSDGDLAVEVVIEEYKKAKAILINPAHAKDKREYLKACQTVANVEYLMDHDEYYRRYLIGNWFGFEDPLLRPEDYTDEKIEEALRNQLQN